MMVIYWGDIVIIRDMAMIKYLSQKDTIFRP